MHLYKCLSHNCIASNAFILEPREYALLFLILPGASLLFLHFSPHQKQRCSDLVKIEPIMQKLGKKDGGECY
jgi:hypothetical protein